MPTRATNGVYQKLIRAEEHLRAFDDEVRTYLDIKPYQIVVEDRGQKHVLILHITQDPPIRLSILLGDCLHNLRSSLDYIAFELVRLNGKETTNRTCFPIFDDPTKYAKSSGKHIDGMSVQVQALIEGLQPYHGGDVANHPLFILYTLSNIDKHRYMHLTAAMMDTIYVRITTTGPNRIRSTRNMAALRTSDRILRHKAEIAQLPFTADEALSLNVEVQAQGRAFVSLDERGLWAQSLSPLMHQILNHIRQGILPALEPLFDEPS